MRRVSKTYLVTLSLFLGLSYFDFVSSKDRVLTIRNLCNEPVWFGSAGGSVRSRNSQDTRCGGDADCYQGSKCIRTGDINQCFFENPKIDGNDFKINSGASKQVTLPIYDNGLDIIWSGAMTGKTGCDEKG